MVDVDQLIEDNRELTEEIIMLWITSSPGIALLAGMLLVKNRLITKYSSFLSPKICADYVRRVRKTMDFIFVVSDVAPPPAKGYSYDL